MNSQKLQDELSLRLGCESKEASWLLEALMKIITEELQEGKTVAFLNIGLFEVRKEMERIVINPLTGQRFLEPPKLSLHFIACGECPEEDRERVCRRVDLKDLSVALAERRQTDKTNAEMFVRAFFSILNEALSTDKYVKIKDFGTFKLIGASAGNGVKGKVVFTSEASLCDIINKPFSQFEPVLLKDNVHFDDLPEPESERESAQKTFSESDATLDETKSIEAELPTERKRHVPLWTVACILLAGILIGGGCVWMFMSPKVADFSGKLPEIESNHEADVWKHDRKYDSLEASVSDEPLPKEMEEERKKPAVPERALPDTVEYDFGVSQTSHTLRAGESLAKIAQKFYGNKKLWPYLARYNRKAIPNPDNIPIGTVIQIPVLVPKK